MIANKTRKPLLMLLIAATSVSLTACAQNLRPAADAMPAPYGGATASAGGVTVVTMTPDFPGIVDIESAVTPVKVKITNSGKSSVLVRYGEFTLVGADGTSYPALPLYKIDASVSSPLPFDPIVAPAFRYNRFRVAAPYGRVYPGIPAFGGRFGRNRFGWNSYDEAFWGGFGEVKLPTLAMYQNVVPEGVLDPGGSLEGWLYFKHIPVQRGTVTFNAAVTALDGGSLGKIAIPYMFAK